MDSGRKRRKWDVAAPQGIPTNQGVGNTGTPAFGFASPGLSQQFIPQGLYSNTQHVAQPRPLLDVKDLKPGQPLDPSLIAKAQKAAAAAVANINKDLVRKGIVVPGRGALEEEKKEFCRDVTINDAPPAIRHHLTKRSTQDDIARRTGTVLTVKGRYYAPGEPEDEAEKPLFLRVSPGMCLQDGEAVAQQQVNTAAAEIQRLLQGQGMPRGQGGPPLPHAQARPGFQQANGAPFYHNAGGPEGPGHQGPSGPPRPYAPTPGQGPTPPTQPIVIPLYINLEPAPGFDIALKVRGPGDSFLKHIGAETGATVILKGRGSGMQETNEALHVLITAPNVKASEEAQKLATHLIDTVRNEYQKSFPYGPPAAGPSPQGPQGYYGSPGYPQRPGAAPGAGPYGGPPNGPPGQYPPAGGPQGAYGPPAHAAPYTSQPGYAPYGPPGVAAVGHYPYPGYGGGPTGPPGQAQYPPGGYIGQPGAPGYRPAPGAYPPPYGAPGSHPGMPPPGGQYPPPQQAAHMHQGQQSGQMHQGQQAPPSHHQQPPQQLQQGETGSEQRKRRFSEFKEGSTNGPSVAGPPRYAPPAEIHSQGGQQRPGTMGPLPPHGQMGPPPPRQPMGPPPPPSGGQASSNAGRAVGSLMGLVDYGDAD
eukprot:jgi/Botrbrau1/22875/Bobra.0065s0033.1